MSEGASTIRVLHVDDDHDVAETTAIAVEREDERIQVEATTSVSDGLDRLADEQFDCVVSDYDMPRRNGIEFLEAVREEHPDVPFILYTGKGSEEVASEAISAGVTDYLQKGSGSEQYAVLANRIANAVESYRSQQALAERNQDLRRYKHMVNSMQEAACIYDTDGKFEIVNEYLARWYDTTREALEGESSDLLSIIEEHAEIEEPYQSLLEGRCEQLSGEVESEFPGHGRAVLEYRLAPLNVDGTIEGVVGVARDITERKEREEELRRTERRYQAVFDDPNILVGLLDTDGTVLDVNQTAMEYVDATIEDVLHEPFWETPWFTHSETVQGDVRAWVGRAASGEYVEFETDLMGPNEDTHTVEGVFRPVTNENGDIVSLLISDRDITERKERERELEHANRQLELALQEAQAGIWEWNVETDELYWSDEMLDMLGIPEDEFDSEINTFEERLHPADGDRVETAIENAIETGEPYRVEQRLRNAAGEYVWLDVRGQVLDDKDSLSMIGIAIDITERKEQEAQLQRQRDRLNEFASVVSHDLRNPLNVVEGRLELARNECDSEHLDAIDTAVTRMEKLIDDLLTLAREGEQVSEGEQIDLAALAERSWENVDTAGASIRIELELTIRADPSRLQQLLENLMRNAVEHGGEAVTVTVGQLEEGFYVEDDGVGIAADERDSVFDAGYSTAEHGTGFGLSIVKQIVEAHGWDIRVSEGTEGGARFEITGVESAAG